MAQDHHNEQGYLTLLASMVFTIAFMIYLVFIHPGVELDTNQPQKQEQAK